MKLFLLLATLACGVWSLTGPSGAGIWLLESFAVIIALPLLVLTHKRFPLTPLVYWLLFIHGLILLTGARYTYAETPLGFWMQDWFGFDRNHYDRIGHIAQGLVPALIGRELLTRTSSLARGKWMAAVLVLSCLGISALYEVFEWIAAEVGGHGADAFLATQGDAWDTQKDMALAGIGAAAGLVLLSRWHDRQLAEIAGIRPHA